MRITSFSVSNLRSIGQEVRLDGLGPLVVLHGRNNAGKSNLLRALDTAFRLLARLGRFVGRPMGTEVGFAPGDIGLAGEILHRKAGPGASARVRVETADPVLVVEFEIRPRKPDDVRVSLLACRVEDEPEWVLSSAESTGDLLPILTRLVEAPPFVYLGQGNASPFAPKGLGWYLLHLSLSDRADHRRRWDRLVEAFRPFEAEMGPGRLDLVLVRGAGDPDTYDLAWKDPAGNPLPFSEQGAGIQELARVLATVLALEAPIVALEEPESHLALEAQVRLMERLKLACEEAGKQILVTSHSYAFDGQGAWWQVVREDGDTQARRRSVVAMADRSRVERDLEQCAAAEGGVEPSWITPTGLLRVPEKVRARLGVLDGDLLSFERLPDGRYAILTSEQLEAILTRGEPS